MGARQPRYINVDTTVSGAIDTAFTVMSELRDELQEWYDNLPEPFQNGDKGNQLQEAIDGISQYADDPPDPDSDLGDLPVTVRSDRKPESRSQRRDDATVYLTSALEALEAHADTLDEEDEKREGIQELVDTLNEANDAFQDVTFPGMYS